MVRCLQVKSTHAVKRASIGLALAWAALELTGCMGFDAGGPAPRIKVQVGYADSGMSPTPPPTPGRFPSPWLGDPDVTFIGTGPKFDAGAIRIVNDSDEIVTIDKVTVDIGSHHFDLWGVNFKVPAHGSLILTQTAANLGNSTTGAESNFDTSDVGVAPTSGSPEVPVVHVRGPGIKLDLSDTNLILTFAGRDVAGNNENESHPWTNL